jgi:hypothetical protein
MIKEICSNLCSVYLLVFIIVLILIFILSLTNFFRSSLIINKKIDTKTELEFDSSKLPISNKNGGVSWSFVMCFYINDWQYKYGSDKNIFDWSNNNGGVKAYFDYKTNSLNIDITTIPLMKNETIKVNDIPIQKWCTLIIILDGRNVDIFMDGDLVKSEVLNYVPYYKSNDIILFSDGGFDGYMGYFQYFNYKLNINNISHFDNVKNAITRDLPFYSPWFYTISYSYKNIFNKILLIFNRMFRFINTNIFDAFIYIINFIKYILYQLYFYVIHFF